MPVHLRPSAATAADAIICGDPARALGLAQELLAEPRMSNHHRGLWGYYGQTPEGLPLTIQATGLGGPSAAVVISELAELGVERLIRLGTCTSTDPAAQLGSALVLSPVLGLDGTSAALIGHGAELHGDPAFIAHLVAAGLEIDRALSTDLYYPETIPVEAGGARIHDLQSAAALAAAQSLGLRIAATAIIARCPQGRLEDEPLEAAGLRLGRILTVALTSGSAAAVLP